MVSEELRAALAASGGLLLRAADQPVPDGWSSLPLAGGIVVSFPNQLDNRQKVEIKTYVIDSMEAAARAGRHQQENRLLTARLATLLSETDSLADESTLGRLFDFLSEGASYAIVRNETVMFNSGIDHHTLAIELRRMAGQSEQRCAIAQGERFGCRSGPFVAVVDNPVPLDDVARQLIRLTVARLAERRRQHDLHELIERLYNSANRVTGRAASADPVALDLGRLDQVESDFLDVLDATLRDSLTQAYNRTKIEDVLDRLAAQSRPFAVILADIDHFKSVNDTFGHLVGDRAIVDVVSTIGDEARSTDLVARWGGEEFLVILPDTDLAMARNIAERMRTAIDRRVAVEERSLTCSFGVAEGRGRESVNDLLSRVDAALYRAKSGGRNLVIADPDPAPRTGG